MLDRSTPPMVAQTKPTASLPARRTLYFALAGGAFVGVLWLATAAVPLRDPAAFAFVALFAITLPWSVIGFLNASIGFVVMRCSRDPVAAVNPLARSIMGDEPIVASTAILACIRNEDPDQVIRNLRPLLDGLIAARAAGRFHVYILSDSSDPLIITLESELFAAFVAAYRDNDLASYRRRADNNGFKAGNIRDFCDRWGEAYDFAITFDADSFMPAEAVLRMVRIMQANPSLGILQSLSVGMPSTSAFARLFQFGMRLGMHAHTIGAAWWQGDCGPYWGHNAILRLKPFIEHCRLPVLPGRGPLSGAILSHDQVEAALMRRAGLEVRVLPAEGMSWEENPPTLLEFIRRDLRWCHGNMQYWRLLATPGLRPVSRFQFVFAILMYLGSPAWIALLALSTLAIGLSDASLAPVFKAGPGAALFAVVMFMIFAPKIATCLDILLRRSARRAYGGAALFIANVLCETVFSVLLSPVMALTHTVFLFRLLVLGRGETWNSQNRQSHAIPATLALKRLWPQTLVGLSVLAVFAMRKPWDIGYGLMCAGGLAICAPFAAATASPGIGALFARMGVGRIPEETEPPPALAPLHLAAITLAASASALAQSPLRAANRRDEKAEPGGGQDQESDIPI